MRDNIVNHRGVNNDPKTQLQAAPKGIQGRGRGFEGSNKYALSLETKNAGIILSDDERTELKNLRKEVKILQWDYNRPVMFFTH